MWLNLLKTKTSLKSKSEPEIDPNTLKGKDRPLYIKKVLMDLGWKVYLPIVSVFFWFHFSIINIFDVVHLN